MEKNSIMDWFGFLTDVDPVSYVGQVQGHEKAVPDPEGAPQQTVIAAPLLQSHVSLSPKGEIQTPPNIKSGVYQRYHTYISLGMNG